MFRLQKELFFIIKFNCNLIKNFDQKNQN
jgi:hypothetical protein